MAKDPVCGMTVDPSKAAATSVYHGQTYCFCAPACKKAFDKEPGKYASSPEPAGGHKGHGHHCC